MEFEEIDFYVEDFCQEKLAQESSNFSENVQPSSSDDLEQFMNQVLGIETNHGQS